MDAQVIIVGAGPVGLMLAGELRLGGAGVIVLERLATPTTESRASTLHARTMEILDQRGLLAPLGTPPHDPVSHFGGLPLDLGGQPSRYRGQWKVPQARVEALLAEWAGGLGADIRRAYEVTGLVAGEDGVEVEAAGPGGPVRLTAAYVVGCDGEDSVVRRLGGFGFPGHDATRELVRSDVTGLGIRNRRFERTPNGLAIAATRDGVTRVMVHEFGRPPGVRDGEPEFAEVAGIWSRVTGEDISGGTPIWVNAFGNTTRLAARYRQGRLLLAGDAAHRQMPVGGQALNLGLQDAVNLGWKLAAEVTGRASAGLLDTYHTERHAVGERVLGNIEAQALLLLGGGEVDALRAVTGELMGHAAVRDRLGAMISGLDIRYDIGGGPLVGARLPHLDLVTDSGVTSTTALLRGGRGVLLDLSGDPARSAALTALAAGRVDTVTAAAAPDAPLEGQETVLLRPDGYVAWAGDRAADPSAALDRWFGAARTAGTSRWHETRKRDSEERGGLMPSKIKATSEARSPEQAQTCDVLILGSGLAGSVAGACLARQGANVVLVDAGQHPRFAIGESMTPQLVEWLRICEKRFQVPEIGYLLDAKSVAKNIGPHHGRKQSFGFIKHNVGQEPDPDEATMFVIPKVLTDASHLFRQDTDQFFFNVAAKYGCTTRQNWRAADLDFDDDGVTVTGQNGEVFRAKYLIDASGFRSPLAEKFDLREKPARFKHHARSMFTHFIDLKPFDEVSHHPVSKRPPAKWHDGTLHHLIDRGWFWIIPFNNLKGSANPVVSVGLTIDERTYPKPKDMSPEEEFNKFLDMYPAVKRQFAGAKRVREWISTDRLQYSSKRSIGHRWCLMSHAAGFLDPLFSRGLSNTFEVVYSLCTRILDALEDDDWSEERFEYVERLERGLLQYNDDLVNSSYISFSHFRLWNAMFRVWAGYLTPGVIRLVRAVGEFELTGDDKYLRDLEHPPYPGLWFPESHNLKKLLDLAAETCEKYEVGEIDGDTAADIIFDQMRKDPTMNPVFGFKDPESTRFIWPTSADIAKFMWWANTKAPEGEMRQMARQMVKVAARATAKGKRLI
ncbi:FAD-dependent monooxygenase [Streptomyces sp. URMC 129]|uniref:FAD-dependent monooxygenase n=1 Tax=Streptomyces sp. URMC 129 TaxID=3423407 RepID=UPI003F1B2CA9